jgi:hypothetical protein
MKWQEVREMGHPHPYLSGLLHNPKHAPKYFESNHLTRGRHGLTRDNLYLTATVPFMR